MSVLALYYFPSCPYCQKVLRFIREENMDVTLKDIHQNDAYRQELLKVGGKTQVPCLFIDGKPLYESDDIIDWLDEHR